MLLKIHISVLEDFASLTEDKCLELSFEIIKGLNLLTSVNDSYILANDNCRQAIERTYTTVLSRLPLIPDNKMAAWSKLLDQTSDIIAEYFDADVLLDALYKSAYPKLENLKPVFECIFVTGHLMTTGLLSNISIQYATEEIKTYILGLTIDAQLKHESLWIKAHKWDDTCATMFKALSTLYLSIKNPDLATTAKFLSISDEVERTLALDKNLPAQTTRYIASAYQMFDNTRTLILGQNKEQLLSTARALGVLGNYTYWLSAISGVIQTTAHENKIEY